LPAERTCGIAKEAAEKVGLHAVQPAAAKAAIDFAALTARLKPRPFKTRSKSEFFRNLLGPRRVFAETVQ
jgi:hypothetical protein